MKKTHYNKFCGEETITGLKRKKGITLVELIVGLAITIFMMSAVYVSFIMGFKNLSRAKHRTAAVNFMESEIESLRTGGFDGIDPDDFPVVNNPVIDYGPDETGMIQATMRTTVTDIDDAGTVIGRYIVVTIQWAEEGVDYNDQMETIIYDY